MLRTFENSMAEKLELAAEDRKAGERFYEWFMRLAGMCTGCSSAEELELRAEALCLGEWTGECPAVDGRSFEAAEFTQRAYPEVNYRFFSKKMLERLRAVFLDFASAAWVVYRNGYLGPEQLKALTEWMSRRPRLGPFMDSVSSMCRERIRRMRTSLRQMGRSSYAPVVERVISDMTEIVSASGREVSA